MNSISSYNPSPVVPEIRRGNTIPVAFALYESGNLVDASTITDVTWRCTLQGFPCSSCPTVTPTNSVNPFMLQVQTTETTPPGVYFIGCTYTNAQGEQRSIDVPAFCLREHSPLDATAAVNIGPAGTIEQVVVNVDQSTGTPSCEVTLGGTPEARIITLNFSGLKGETPQITADEQGNIYVDGQLLTAVVKNAADVANSAASAANSAAQFATSAAESANTAAESANTAAQAANTAAGSANEAAGAANTAAGAANAANESFGTSILTGVPEDPVTAAADSVTLSLNQRTRETATGQFGDDTPLPITLPAATESAAGFMSAADKASLDGMPQQISEAVSGEAEARQQADNTLQENITAEQTRAEGQEAAIRSEFSAADAANLQAAEQYADNSVSTHNTSETAHTDIRGILATCTGLPTYDPATYKLTFQTNNGQQLVVDLPIEQMNLRYNAETQSIEFDNGDGSVSSIPVSEFLTEYVGSNGTEIVVTIGAGNAIQASIVGNSIAWEKLSLALQQKINDKADTTYVDNQSVPAQANASLGQNVLTTEGNPAVTASADNVTINLTKRTRTTATGQFGGDTAAPIVIPAATESAAGLMSAADKASLDSLPGQISGIQIGGVNLLDGSETISVKKEIGNIAYIGPITLSKGKTYIYSLSSFSGSANGNLYLNTEYPRWDLGEYQTIEPNTPFVATADFRYLFARCVAGSEIGDPGVLERVMFEEGNKVTSWFPSFNDLQNMFVSRTEFDTVNTTLDQINGEVI